MNITIDQLAEALRGMAAIVDKTSAQERFWDPASLAWAYKKQRLTTELEITIRITADAAPAISPLTCQELAGYLGQNLCQSPANMRRTENDEQPIG